eukprot:Skav203689  [mRNA]  locus=scaffold259:196146:196583:+ [translate_table: standard]
MSDKAVQASLNQHWTQLMHDDVPAVELLNGVTFDLNWKYHAGEEFCAKSTNHSCYESCESQPKVELNEQNEQNEHEQRPLKVAEPEQKPKVPQEANRCTELHRRVTKATQEMRLNMFNRNRVMLSAHWSHSRLVFERGPGRLTRA